MNKLLKFFFSPIAFLLSLTIILIRPFFLIRFALLPDERIGHFVQDIAIYILKKKKNNHLDFFCFSHKKHNANQFIKKKWEEQLNLLPDFLLIPISKLIQIFYYLLPFQNPHSIRMNSFDQNNDIFKSKKKIFTLSRKEALDGINKQIQLGIPKNKKFIVLIIRDQKFLKTISPEKNWDYHKYRNINLNKFKKLVNYFTGKGIYVVRMGKIVEKKFPIKNNSLFIDYPFTSQRSDFMDYFLCRNALFAVSTLTGLDSLCYVNKVPILGLQHPFNTPEILNRCTYVTFKKLYSKKKKDILTIEETLKYYENTNKNSFKNQHFKIIDNTDEEILNAGKDMLNYVLRKKIFSGNTQSKYWKKILDYINKTYKTNYKTKIIISRISPSFVIKNKRIFT